MNGVQQWETERLTYFIAMTKKGTVVETGERNETRLSQQSYKKQVERG